ncbi:MAG: hypothetical protein HYY04_13505 [Chloroflexi bacterium]|nr:hypothetical protein [Chloroflexota bacterium]
MAEPRTSRPTSPHLAREEFGRFQALILDRYGLTLDERHRRALRATLAARLAATGRPGYASYHDLLLTSRGEGELRRLIEAVAIGETSFFRTPVHFEALRTRIIPELLARRGGVATFRLWSAGCATGEEAYSAAISVLAAFPADRPPVLQVIGTDVSERALAAAAAGRYSPRAVRDIPRDWLARYFARDGAHFVVRPELRRVASFRYLNLVRDPYPAEDLTQLDVIFCENVLIYFQPETSRRIIQRLAACLRPGGYLFLGYSETLWKIADAPEVVDLGGGYAYHKPGLAAGRRSPRGGGALTPYPSPTGRGARGEGGPVVAREDQVAVEEPSPPTPLLVGEGRGVRAAPSPGPPVAAEGIATRLLAAREYVNRMDGDRARRELTAILELDPLQTEAYLLLGILDAQSGQTEAAIDALRRALYLDPHLALAQFHLADIQRRGGDLAASARGYAQAAELLAAVPEDQLVGEFSAGLLRRVCLEHVARLGRE